MRKLISRTLKGTTKSEKLTNYIKTTQKYMRGWKPKLQKDQKNQHDKSKFPEDIKTNQNKINKNKTNTLKSPSFVLMREWEQSALWQMKYKPKPKHDETILRHKVIESNNTQLFKYSRNGKLAWYSVITSYIKRALGEDKTIREKLN